MCDSKPNLGSDIHVGFLPASGAIIIEATMSFKAALIFGLDVPIGSVGSNISRSDATRPTS